MVALNTSKIRVISLDVTGTLVTTREPVIKSYYDAAIWARLPNPPSQTELKAAFKTAFKERSLESPAYGGVEKIPGREWWRTTVRRVLDHAGRSEYTEEEFDRYFRRVYQHFGSPRGYMVLEDADALLTSVASNRPELLLGITSNTPTRHMESVLPMLDIHDHFSFFACSQDVGHEKPAPEIFETAFRQARFWMPDLKKEEVLHIGDSLACDYCGARAYGFQALMLDRSDDPKITAYQEWIAAPEYPGKSEDDIRAHTITSLKQVVEMLEKS